MPRNVPKQCENLCSCLKVLTTTFYMFSLPCQAQTNNLWSQRQPAVMTMLLTCFKRAIDLSNSSRCGQRCRLLSVRRGAACDGKRCCSLALQTPSLSGPQLHVAYHRQTTICLTVALRMGSGVGKQGYGNRPPIDDRNPIRKFSIDPLCLQNQWDSTDSPRQRIKEKSRCGNSVSTPYRRYGHRLRTPFLRAPFPRLLRSQNIAFRGLDSAQIALALHGVQYYVRISCGQFASRKVRNGETTIKLKFSLFEGGGALGAERKIVQNAVFRGKRHDNKILKSLISFSKILLSLRRLLQYYVRISCGQSASRKGRALCDIVYLGKAAASRSLDSSLSSAH